MAKKKSSQPKHVPLGYLLGKAKIRTKNRNLPVIQRLIARGSTRPKKSK